MIHRRLDLQRESCLRFLYKSPRSEVIGCGGYYRSGNESAALEEDCDGGTSGGDLCSTGLLRAHNQFTMDFYVPQELCQAPDGDCSFDLFWS
jgi:hypothetical protein